MAKPKVFKIPGQHLTGYATEKMVVIVGKDGKGRRRRVRWVRNRNGFQEVIALDGDKNDS